MEVVTNSLIRSLKKEMHCATLNIVPNNVKKLCNLVALCVGQIDRHDLLIRHASLQKV